MKLKPAIHARCYTFRVRAKIARGIAAFALLAALIAGAAFAVFRSAGGALEAGLSELSAEIEQAEAAEIADASALSRIDVASLENGGRFKPSGAFVTGLTIHKKHPSALDFGEAGRFFAVRAGDGVVAISREEIVAPEGAAISAAVTMLASKLTDVPPPLGAEGRGVTILLVHKVIAE